MNKFKDGDRVAFYISNRYTGTISGKRNDLVGIDFDIKSKGHVWIHYKQCRKLKAKAKAKDYYIKHVKEVK